MEQLWTWSKVDAINGLGEPIRGPERCTYFEKELCFDLRKIMWRKHRSSFQDHVKYVHNYSVKPFRVEISSTMSASVRCMTYPSTYFHIWWRAMSTIRKIGPSVTNNYLRMRFVLQLRTDFQHPCRMKWNTKINIIAPCPTNNSVILCKPQRKNITEREMWLKSKDLRPLRQRQQILIVINLKLCRARIR